MRTCGLALQAVCCALPVLPCRWLTEATGWGNYMVLSMCLELTGAKCELGLRPQPESSCHCAKLRPEPHSRR